MSILPNMAVQVHKAPLSIPGSKTMLMGPPGSGKTSALATLPACSPNLKSFTIFLEPSGMSMLHHIPDDRFHWKYIPSSQAGWDALKNTANSLNTFTQKALQGLSNVDSTKYRQFIDLITALTNLTCDRCGRSFGNSEKLGTDWVLNLDSLSPLNDMAMDLVAGGKPFKSESDWGAGIEMEKKFLNMLTLGHRCHFILIAHTSRETDPESKIEKIMPGALGRKFPQEIGRFFDDIPYSHISNGKFLWSTVVTGVDSKSRRLPLGKDYPPSFVPIFQAWEKQGGLYVPTAP